MKRALRTCIGFLTSFLLVACNACAVQPGSQTYIIDEPNPLDTPTPAVLTIVPTRTPTENTSQPRTTWTPRAASQPFRSPEPIILYRICSPLVPHTLAELPEIVSDAYNPPAPGHEERHHGVDFSYYRRGERLSIGGAGVQSVFDGRVAAAIHDEYPYGNMVIVETPGAYLPAWMAKKLQVVGGESLYLLYAHLGEEPAVKLGDSVEACQPLGLVGKSGDFVMEHLHLETRIGPAGSEFASMAYYHSRTTVDQRENYELWRTSGVFRHFDPMELLTLEGE